MLFDFFDLIFPRCCSACNSGLLNGEHLLCIHCLGDLPYTKFHTDPNNLFVQKFWGRVPIKYGLPYLFFRKGGVVQNIIHRIKYKGDIEIAKFIGFQYGLELIEANYSTNFDIIIPVPLHNSKLAKRGYNQSALYGIGLSEGLQVDYSERPLIRIKEKISQTKMNRFNRWGNVKEIYKINDSTSIEGKNVLLVDDVCTTGSTLEICSSLLLAAGAKSVSVSVIAMAQ